MDSVPRGQSRRRFLRTSVAAGTVGVAGCTDLLGGSQVDLVPEDDWPSFQRTPANPGHNPNTTALGTNVEAVWEHSVQRSARIQPTIADGYLYVGGGTLRRPSELRAIDLDSQTEAWSVGTETGITSAPAATADGIVVGLDADLVAVDRDGNKHWRYGTADKIYSDPTVIDGTALVGSDDSSLYAVDVTTGEERWRFRTGGRISPSPAVDDGLVIVGSMDGNTYALSVDSGEQQWQRDIGDQVRASAAIVDGVAYVGSEVSGRDNGWNDGHLLAFDVGSGEEQWRFPVPTGIRYGPAVSEDTVVFKGHDMKIHALNRSDGTERWKYDLDARTAPTIGDGVTYVGNINDGSVYALDLETGEVRWTFKVGYQMSGGIVPLGDTVFVAGWDATVYALRSA